MQQTTDLPVDPHMIVMLVYPGIMTMDMFGQLEAFTTANRVAGQPRARIEGDAGTQSESNLV
jgi:hypothetical protein